MSPFSIPLDSSKLNSALANSYWRVRVVDITGSTQTDLTSAVRKNEARPGDVLVTEYQSAGRGRLDRSFVAQPGTALLFSFYITLAKSEIDLGWLPLLTGQALCTSLEEVLKIDSAMKPLLKWPNDILINDRKVGGILAERIDSENGLGVVVGVGLNFFATRDQLPISNATSLVLEGFTGTSRADLLVSFLKNMSEYLQRWESGDLLLIQEYIDRSATIGMAVLVELPNGDRIDSVAISIARSGALILENGSQITVGDVVHVRTI